MRDTPTGFAVFVAIGILFWPFADSIIGNAATIVHTLLR